MTLAELSLDERALRMASLLAHVRHADGYGLRAVWWRRFYGKERVTDRCGGHLARAFASGGELAQQTGCLRGAARGPLAEGSVREEDASAPLGKKMGVGTADRQTWGGEGGEAPPPPDEGSSARSWVRFRDRLLASI